jgi:hypothetical protein
MHKNKKIRFLFPVVLTSVFVLGSQTLVFAQQSLPTQKIPEKTCQTEKTSLMTSILNSVRLLNEKIKPKKEEISTAATSEPPLPIESTKLPKILPHRAEYDVNLLEVYGDDDVEDAKGWMTIEIIDTGDGWSIRQKSGLMIYSTDGSAEQIMTTLTTYESKDGLQYTFKAITLRNGEDEEVLSGEAVLATKDGEGIVTYKTPENLEVKLPRGTIFPMQHLARSLGAALNGENILSTIVFDGSSETHEPVDVNTIIGKATDPKLNLSDSTLINATKVWPMRMAIYPLNSDAPESDYEIQQSVLNDGVIRNMTLDYGTFSVEAKLSKVDVFAS